MNHRAFFNTAAIAAQFFRAVGKLQTYNGRKITSVGVGGDAKYRPNGACTFIVIWSTE